MSGCEDTSFFITVRVADTDQKSINLLQVRLPPQRGGNDRALNAPDSLNSSVLGSANLHQWVNIVSKVAGKVVHHVSERAPPRSLSAHQMSCLLSCSLMECGVWRAVIRSVLHHPAGQNGRDDTGDLWIIYQRWRLSHGIKNVALAQMTFSHHHVLITQCHKDPPPLLPYLAALMSGHAINYAPKNYAWLRASRQVDPDLMWHEKLSVLFLLFDMVFERGWLSAAKVPTDESFNSGMKSHDFYTKVGQKVWQLAPWPWLLDDSPLTAK